LAQAVLVEQLVALVLMGRTLFLTLQALAHLQAVLFLQAAVEVEQMPRLI
jgi:hypothetical protein